MKSEKSSEILKYFNFMWRTMKKLFSIILILVALLQISLTSAFATTSVSFEMQNADMKPNRLFSVALSANSGNRLSAATFEFTYDPDYIEFRKVKAVNNGSKIQVNKKSGKIKVVFLNSEGQNISGGSDVLTLDFKTIKEGTAYIDYTVNQCVDSDVNFMDVEVALHRVSEYIKMHLERLAAEVPRQAIKTVRKLQERAVKVNTRPSLQLLMPQMTNILITIPLKISK